MSENATHSRSLVWAKKGMDSVCTARHPVHPPQSSHVMVKVVSMKRAKVSMMAVMLGLMTWMAIVMMTETTLVMRGMVMKRWYDYIVGYSDGRGISSER